MPTLRAMMDLIASKADLSPALIESIETDIRRAWPGERVYLPPVDSRKDPRRAERVRELAKRLPVGVVAVRLGVSQSAVYRAVKRKNKD
jgi:hypothetical protein